MPQTELTLIRLKGRLKTEQKHILNHQLIQKHFAKINSKINVNTTKQNINSNRTGIADGFKLLKNLYWFKIGTCLNGRHSSVVSSPPTILQHRVQISWKPHVYCWNWNCTCNRYWNVKMTKIYEKEAGIVPFKKCFWDVLKLDKTTDKIGAVSVCLRDWLLKIGDSNQLICLKLLLKLAQNVRRNTYLATW